MNNADTIVAISSATGQAARMILRLSGPRSLEFVRSMRSGSLSLRERARVRADSTNDVPLDEKVETSVAPHADPLAEGERENPVFREWISFANLSAPAWIYLFKNPKSYTGDDSAELHIPGNPLLAKLLLEHLIQSGARLAEPGEFTARAFFNGKIDLTEAEGVAATISAQNEQELAAARQLMAGELSRRLHPIIDLLAETLALNEVGIDFVDEDVTFLSKEETLQRLDSIDAQLTQLQSDSVQLEQLSHEPRIVLLGKPNAGKSTLLNALAGETRAVVSPVAGTTRDVIWAHVRLKRGIVRVVDVAGIDSSSGEGVLGEVAQEMQSRAQRAIEEADVVVLVNDSMDDVPMTHERVGLMVMTKSDLRVPPQRRKRVEEPADEIDRLRLRDGLRVSAHTGEGLDELKQSLDHLAFGSTDLSQKLALNARHLKEIDSARMAISRAKTFGIASVELLAMDLREALDSLGSIVGSISPDELLGRIFARFCIGK